MGNADLFRTLEDLKSRVASLEELKETLDKAPAPITDEAALERLEAIKAEVGLLSDGLTEIGSRLDAIEALIEESKRAKKPGAK